jgi:hypothetical protein
MEVMGGVMLAADDTEPNVVAGADVDGAVCGAT